VVMVLVGGIITGVAVIHGRRATVRQARCVGKHVGESRECRRERATVNNLLVKRSGKKLKIQARILHAQIYRVYSPVWPDIAGILCHRKVRYISAWI